MKKRPILFQGAMVRALLAGTKTQTRRVVKGDVTQYPGSLVTSRVCPYGQPGDRLWVRETFADLTEKHGQRWERFNEATRRYERGTHAFLWYRADGDQPDIGDGALNPERWRPSIQMPSSASRILLEITGVRVERLQDINGHDAAAEGVSTWAPGALSPEGQTADPEDQYRWLWESINGPGSWGADPWVWVVEFKRVQS